MPDLTTRLLAEIERRDQYVYADQGPERYAGSHEVAYLGALREVVGYHDRRGGAWISPDDGRAYDGCITCTPGIAYPCPTLRAVADALGVAP